MAGHPFKAHLVGIDAGVKKLVSGINRRCKSLEGVNADPFGALGGQQIAGSVEIKFVADFVPAVASVGVGHRGNDGFAQNIDRDCFHG